MPVVDNVPLCIRCNQCCGFDVVKMPGGGPFAAVCKGCGAHNDPEELGFDLRDIVDFGPFEERYMAKQKVLSPLEQRMEAIKAGTAPRKVRKGPTFAFPGVKLEAVMKRLDCKVATLADVSGVEEHYVGAARKGENIRLAQAMKLAKACGMSVEDLFGEPQTKAAENGQVARNATSPLTDPMFSEPAGENAEGDPE